MIYTTNNKCFDQKIIHKLATDFATIVKQQFDDALIAIYVYGSIMTNDYTVKSDIDFVVILRKIDRDTKNKVVQIHQTLCEINPEYNRLEGGYHRYCPGDQSRNCFGIWVENAQNIEECLSIEPDSIDSILNNGYIVYGCSPERLFTAIDCQTLIDFSVQYIKNFISKMPERSSSPKRLFSSVLNLCRSSVYLSAGYFPTKTDATTRIAQEYPNYEQLLYKVLFMRSSKENIDRIEKADIRMITDLAKTINRSLTYKLKSLEGMK